MCKMAVKYVDGILEQNATEAQIEEAVRKVCSFFPDSLRTEVSHPLTTLNYQVLLFYYSNSKPKTPQCDQLVQQYEPVLIQLLLQMMDPDFVCMVSNNHNLYLTKSEVIFC